MITELLLAAGPETVASAQLAVESGHHSHMSTADIIEFLITGGIVVYGTLILLAVLGVVGGRFFVMLEKRVGDVDDPLARQKERQRRKADMEEQQRIVAVISASVAQTIQGPHRVISFKQVGPSNWSVEGRAAHHASHQVR